MSAASAAREEEDRARAEQRAAETQAHGQIGHLIRLSRNALQAGNTRKAARFRLGVEEAMSATSTLRAYLAQSLQSCGFPGPGRADEQVQPPTGGGQALVQPVHVEDLGRAAVDALASATTARREYDLPGADAAPLRQLIDHVARELGRLPLVVPLPIRPMAALAGAWSRLGLPPRVSAEQVLRLLQQRRRLHLLRSDDAVHRRRTVPGRLP
jgi:uncharacterized protein YbjT (DUF2867 family)